MDDDELRRRLLKPLDDLQHETNSVETPTTHTTISLAQYVANPTGKGSAYVARRGAIKAGMNAEYIKLLQKFRRAFYAVPYIYDNGDVLFYVKVPSQYYDYNHISYDVLFKIYYNKNVDRKNRSIKMFSNSPSFVYTYCYVYNQNGLIIDELKTKYPNEALTQVPIVRNPILSMGYEKSTYIAAHYLLDGGCLSDSYINRYGKRITQLIWADITNRIADPEVLVKVYQHALYERRKEHAKPLSKEEEKARNDLSKQYAEAEKKNRPKGNFIFSKSPRGNITARKAQKNFKKPVKPKKPKKL